MTIVGAGPVGLTLSLALAKVGVPTRVLERAAGPTTHPQAHFINARSMEMLHSIDPALARRVRAEVCGRAANASAPPKPPTPSRPHIPAPLSIQVRPLHEWRRFEYCTHLATSGTVLGEQDHYAPPTDEAFWAAVTPQPPVHLPQTELVPLLLEACREEHRAPLIEIAFNTRLKHVEVEDGWVRRLSLSTTSEAHQLLELHGGLLVAADGAHSRIRRQLAIPLLGRRGLQHLMNVHFVSPELAEMLQASGRPAMLYFVFNPDTVLVLVAHNLARGQFVAQIPYHPPHQHPTDFSRQVCADLLRAAAGVSSLSLEIKDISPWAMSSLVAKQYVLFSIF